MTLKAKKYSFIIILDHVDFPNATIKNITNTCATIVPTNSYYVKKNDTSEL